MKNIDIVKSFLRVEPKRRSPSTDQFGRFHPDGNLSTDGKLLFSYETVVAVRGWKGENYFRDAEKWERGREILFITREKFSPTTSQQISLLRGELVGQGWKEKA